MDHFAAIEMQNYIFIFWKKNNSPLGSIFKSQIRVWASAKKEILNKDWFFISRSDTSRDYVTNVIGKTVLL